MIFTLDDTSGLDRVETAAHASTARVYSAGGALIRETSVKDNPREALDGLPAGLYIVERTDASGIRSIEKTVIR